MNGAAFAALALAVMLAASAVLIGRMLRDGNLLRRRLAKATQDLERLQLAFSRFAPAELVDELADVRADLRAGKRDVAVLFADLKGFTTLSEQLDPAVLVDILNGYFEAMSAAIGARHGRVAKFMGDGLMALFGAITPNPWLAVDAVRAALDMHAALAGYNDSLRARGLPALSFGVGVHRGEVVAGVIGSRALMEFTVIGDVVNTASRVEGLTRLHDAGVIVTDAIQRDLDTRFRVRALPPQAVKGKAEPLRTYVVEGFQETSSGS